MAQLANWQIGEYFTQGGETLSANSIEWAWRWMFWAELIPAGLFFILSFLLFLKVRVGWQPCKKTTQARAILLRIGGEQYADQTLDELAQLTDKKEEKK